MPKDINSNSAVAQAVATSIASSVSSLNQGTMDFIQSQLRL